jgi:hypothetical protein
MAPKTNLNQLSADERRLLQAWLVSFDNAWDENRLSKQVSDLPRPGSLLRRVALIELVKIDLRRHWQQGQGQRLEEYLEAYPELGTAETVATDLVRAEYEARRAGGIPAEPSHFLRRFPRQAREFLSPATREAAEPLVRQPVRAAKSAPAAAGGHRWLLWLGIAGAAIAALLLVATVSVVLVLRHRSGRPDQEARTGNPPTTGRLGERTGPSRPDPDYVNPHPTPINEKAVAVRLDQESEVDDVGNAKTKLKITMSPERHALIRRQMTQQVTARGLRDIALQMKNVLDFMDLDAAGSILEDAHGEFGAHDIRLQVREIGFAKLQEGRWTYQLSSDPATPCELIEKKDSRRVTVRSIKEIGGSQVVEQVSITLPTGAHAIEVTRTPGKPSQLVYQVPAPPAAPAGAAKPTLALETKPHLMSALYKLYGDPRFPKLWAARSAFQNTGRETLTNYQVRFRIAGYSEWSGWNRSDIVYPGQTVVDNFRPLIDAKVRELKGATPVDIEAEYEYVRASGDTVRDTQVHRSKLLGFNDGVYTDVAIDQDSPWIEMMKGAPLLLASFTAGNDPVVQEVVGRLSKTIGGASPRDTDRAAGLFLQALYDLMRCNISYESAQGSVIDGLLHQHLKYGRDVLRTKAGTCINTSIFFASVAEAAGLDAYVVMVPRHAFAAVRLPQSRQFVFIETTGCGGGTMATSYPYDKVCRIGAKEFQDAAKSGLFLLVGISDLRNQGVMPPELVDAGKNALDEWKIVFPDAAAKEEKPEDPGAVPVPSDQSTAAVVSIRKEPGAVKEGRKGMAFHVHVKIDHARGVPCEVFVICVNENKQIVKCRLETYSLGGNLCNLISLTPGEDQAEYEDLVLFLPYDGFDLGAGRHELAAVVVVTSGGKKLSEVTEESVVPVTITKRR